MVCLSNCLVHHVFAWSAVCINMALMTVQRLTLFNADDPLTPRRILCYVWGQTLVRAFKPHGASMAA